MRYTREQACLAWLSQGMIGGKRLKKLLTEYGSAEALYDAFQRDNGASLQNRISDYSLSLLQDGASREKLHEMLVTMQQWNMGLVTMEDEMYPASLRNIAEPPYLLFYQGDLRVAEQKCITVVGSRSATIAGIAATKALCRDLSEQGVCIVSGLAVGIDAAAHEGCLDGGSPTIGVAASGLNVPYPSENVALKARILAQGGLLLSEYPPDMQASKYVFAVRNRILAGLGNAVVMMEARIRSGSMLTVHHALNQGKDVFAYPGIPEAPMSEGAHQLLREGAVYFTSAQDILEDMGWRPVGATLIPKRRDTGQARSASKRTAAPPKAEKAQTNKKPKPPATPAEALEQEEARQAPDEPLPPMNDEQKRIYDALADGERSFDQLASQTGLDASKLMASLTMLQILGTVKALPGKSYCRAT